MNAWDPHISGTCLQTYNAGKNTVSYAQKKRDVHYSKPPLLPIAISGRWEVITRDCMGSLPATNLGNWYIIVGNLFTKHIITAVLLSSETAFITQMFLDKTVLRHSPSHRFLTNRGTNFNWHFWCNFATTNFYIKLPPPVWWFCWMYQWCYHADNHRVCGLRLQGLGYIPPIIHICLQHQPIWRNRWNSLFPNLWPQTSDTAWCCITNTNDTIKIGRLLPRTINWTN